MTNQISSNSRSFSTPLCLRQRARAREGLSDGLLFCGYFAGDMTTPYLESIVFFHLSQASLRLLVLGGNEQLEETPPVEQGPELLKVLFSFTWFK